ncbi:MAG: UvrD-helicase domain-containing protein [Flavobacteriaceae bacterium]
MKTISQFSIYDAAAGSGKTFTLVKEYLKIILKAKQVGYYKYILAITFTNKAVAEMKQRIIDNLISFSEDDFTKNPPEMALLIASETGLDLSEINSKSKKIITHLLHNYSSFSVETIDSFNHRLIRTFARDLKLSGNFEVSLDIPNILAEAVDLLISKAGENPKITKSLIDYTLEKTDDDKSWDISKDIAKASGLLFSENDLDAIEKIKKKSFDDFLVFKKELIKKHRFLVKSIKEIASETLKLIKEAGLEFTDFSRSSFPKHFQNLANGKFTIKFNNQWQLAIGEVPLYTGGTLKKNPDVAATIDELTPVFKENFIETKKLANEETLINAFLKSITPLSVINLVNQEIEKIKEEQNVLPISEFNRLINSEIKDQPTPFIYERLGERYRHFFIDEFQDTSTLQWQNMMPLVDNSLTQQYPDGQKGSLLLVGDAKQSIYRWRGGKPEQFIDLCNGINPFSIKEKVFNLPTNFRSKKEIISFNNAFFTFISDYFGDEKHQTIYKTGNQQKINNKEGGYIKFEFISPENTEEKHELYAEKVLKTILHLKENGFQEKDICILTRKKNDGILLGAFLQKEGITVVSSETLLVAHSPLVRFLVACLTLSLFPDTDQNKIIFLEFLYKQLAITQKKHTFYAPLLNTERLTIYLKEKLGFSFSEMQSKSLYDSLEYCIQKFNLKEKADAYLYGFMDFTFEFGQKKNASKSAFLEEWELQVEKLSIPISEEVNGVQLMTIHRAKGLEFPVVIFPYADLDIYKELDPKNWFKIEDEDLSFNETLIYSYLGSIEEFGEQGKKMHQEIKNTYELDNINLLYVTLTRAESQLYIFSKKPKEIKDKGVTTYNQFFGEFLKQKGLWEDEKAVYELGAFQAKDTKTKILNIETVNSYFHSSPPEEHQLHVISKDASLWNTDAEKAIASGTLLHETMERVIVETDIISVFEEIKNNTEMTSEEKIILKESINAIVKHPDLNQFFQPSEKVILERKIITSEGNILIPDRLNFHPNGTVSIIDYKTGALNKKNKNQINRYASALIEMGYQVSEKILIYSTSEGILVNKV